MDFLMVFMASGIARGRIHCTHNGGGVAQHGGHPPNNRLTDMQS